MLTSLEVKKQAKIELSQRNSTQSTSLQYMTNKQRKHFTLVFQLLIDQAIVQSIMT